MVKKLKTNVTGTKLVRNLFFFNYRKNVEQHNM